MSFLDNPAWAALNGAHARFAQVHGRAARYQADVSPFYALADPTDPQAWADMTALVGPGEQVVLPHRPESAPSGWKMVGGEDGYQMVAEGVRPTADPEAVVLTAADVPEMIDLVRRTKPGPILPRTIEMGTYVGIRRDGALVALAGERMQPPGWSELSLLCADPAYRRQGLATRCADTIIAAIQAKGEKAFVNVRADNTSAISLYRSIGFTERRPVKFGVYRRVDPS
jgi:ribosomal protein S18 acetylase RimI-like enzyme